MYGKPLFVRAEWDEVAPNPPLWDRATHELLMPSFTPKLKQLLRDAGCSFDDEKLC